MTKSQWLNKTKDSTLTKKDNRNSCLSSATFGTDTTTTNYDNFTNVTASAFDMTDVTSNDDDMVLSSDSDDDLKKNKPDNLKLRNFNSQVSKLTEDIASRTMPQVPQEPHGLSLTMTNFNATSNSLLEPESFSKKYDYLKNEADADNSFVPQNKNIFKIPMAHIENGNNTTHMLDSDVCFF